MSISKKNIAEFNDDIETNGGYLYTTHTILSSVLANNRMSESIHRLIGAYRSLVDIGCGDGVFTNEIKGKFPRIHVEGFDPAADAVALAQEKYPTITFRVINILQENIEQSSRTFEVGILRGVLHHLSDPEIAIRNALKIAGTVIIVEPNGNNPILKIIEKTSAYHRKHEEQSFSSWKLKEWCRRAGGKVVFQEYIGFIPFFFPTLLTRVIYFFQPLLEKIPLIREFFSAQIVLVCKSEQTHVP